jgi:hypothetical protein
MDGAYPVHQTYRSDTPVQLLARDVGALLTVSDEQEAVLGALGVKTVLDLGASLVFGTAHTIVDAAVAGQARSTAPAAGDYVDTDGRDYSFAQLADQSPRVLRLVDDKTANALRDELGIVTLRELAAWPPYTAAQRIVADAYGDSQPAAVDPERPDDLIPVARRYATERVQYDVIVLDHVLDAPARRPTGDSRDHILRQFRAFGRLPAIGVVGALENKGVDIAEAGGIDVSDLVSATLIAQPAVGAVLTYRQSWFPHGLALGHLLHSMALAPGESTRIAMVDWTRRVRASTDEVTTQLEQVASDVSRNRALSEVTSSVAREAQSGFSESASEATQRQAATSYGESKTNLETAGVFGTLGASLFGGSLGGPKVSSFGASTATSTSSGWASSKSSSEGERSLNASLMQNVADRTQQAASSTRDRRATTVVETSQQEGEALTTRIVTNYNHMHALTVQYFEVVQVYRVVLELADLVPCLFVPMKLVTFNDRVVRRYKSVIASVGLTPEVQVLALTEPDQLAVYVPRKAALWEPRYLAELRRALGGDVATPAGTIARLPLEGLMLGGVGSFDPDFRDKVEAIEVTLTNGQRARFPVVDRGEGQNAWNPKFGVDLRTFVARDIASISLVRKDKEFEGDIGIGLSFDVRHPDGPSASDKIDTPGLFIGTRVTCRNEEVTPAFELSAAITTQQLLDHLEENALYYSTAIWRSMDAATITTLLATYTVAGHRLIEVIDPVPVTVSGNYLVFRYYGLDAEQRAKLRASIIKDGDGPTEDLVPLPSGGVFAEAVLSRSNAAEKLDITRFWNWQDSPIPVLPPEINPLTAGGKADDDTPQTGKLESPVVTVVTPPVLPDPAGLAPLYQAIANGNMFRDMSGLVQTAALLQAAMQAAQAGAASATEAAGEAQKVAAQQLTELLKLAAQVALAATTGGAGLAVGAAGAGVAGALGSGKPGVANTATNAGALINQGKDIDGRKQARGSSNGAAAGTSDTGGGGALGAADGGAADASAAGPAAAGSSELNAFETALGTGGGGLGGIAGSVLSTVLGQTGSSDAGHRQLPPPRPSVKDRALDLGKDAELLESYKRFQGEQWFPDNQPRQNWYWSANANLLGSVSKPAQLPTTAAAWNALDSRAKTVLGDLGGFDANTLNPNAAGLAKVKAGYEQWPAGYFAIIQGGGIEPTNTCNIYVGEALFRDGLDIRRSDGKYYSANEIWKGLPSQLVRVDNFDVAAGDIAAWGGHVEIVTRVDYSTNLFCTVSGYRANPPMGTPKCGDTAPATHSLGAANLRFYRPRN